MKIENRRIQIYNFYSLFFLPTYLPHDAIVRQLGGLDIWIFCSYVGFIDVYIFRLSIKLDETQ